MKVFDLPTQTIVNKVIPKNAFDTYTTPKQRKKLAEFVERIRWTNKLSPETVNLSGKDITEIQVFEIELRKQEDISDLLDVFDKAIPYPIVFLVSLANRAFIRTSKKHIHPTQENTSVIDWTFKTNWKEKQHLNFSFDLKKDLDYVFRELCNQLSSGLAKGNSIEELVAFEQSLSQLQSKIAKIKAAIQRTTQFNKKVELNQELRKLQSDLDFITKSGNA